MEGGALPDPRPSGNRAARHAGWPSGEAKTTLSQLIEAAEAGEEIILARAGKPVARLTGLAPGRRIRFGTGKKLFSGLSKDFDRPLSRKEQDRLFGGPVEP